MPSIIENLNSVITTKNELGYILRENGVNPGEVFSDYPSYFRDVISSGGGGSDKVTYSYLEERLSDYVSYSYLNDNLSDYPTYSYSNNNYVSYAYLNEQEYATESYVVEYVAEHGGGEVTYSYLNDNYFKLTGGLLNGSIIPNYTETYSLGGTYNKWAGVYANKYELNGVDIKEIFPSYSYVNKYVTKTELSAQSYITSADIPDLSTYVTKDELSACGYLTSVPNTYPTYAAIESMGYITSADIPDLSTYVTKDELSECGYLTSVPSEYITQDELSANSYLTEHQSLAGYATESYVADYVATYAPTPDLSAYVTKTELSAQSYLTAVPNTYPTYAAIESMGYITSADLPVIDESIVPKTNNTYTLGDENHLYSATYSARLKVGNNSQIYNDGGGITLSVNSNAGIRMGSSTFYPKTNKGYSNGSSTNYWDSTYTSNLYADIATYTKNIILDEWGGGISTNGQWSFNLSINGANRFQVKSDSFIPATDRNRDLGDASHYWRTSYTSYLFLNGTNIKDLINGMFSYDSTTGTLTITTLS